MIKIKDLDNNSVGKTVWYKPGIGKCERGVIKSWNDNNIFVVYPGNNYAKEEHYEKYTAAATKPFDLYWREQT